MSRKIFISYRRQDSAANALGIGQYLENEFGRKNVFIDIDMHAGAKFPKVLEQRLAECAVMLVLIGAGWLNAQDEQGHRRLDDPDDWVRLEIAQALKRDITVIPVRVNGAELPRKAELPDDIRGLLDHQAVSVTNAGFRHEMSGLVHDIRSISKPQRWRYAGAIVVGLALLLAVLALVQTSVLSSVVSRIRLALFPPISKVAVESNIWRGQPGEWVLYQTTASGIPFYFKPSSVETFGNRVTYTSRFLSTPESTAVPQENIIYRNYEDDITVLDCKKSIQALAERTIYNKSGDVITHFKWGEPRSLDLSIGTPINRGSILETAEHIFCDEQLRTPILSKEQIAKPTFLYLTSDQNGDGDIFYGPKKAISNVTYPYEFKLLTKLFKDHKFTDLIPNGDIMGLPVSYRAYAQIVQLNCKDWKIFVPKAEYFDSENNLIFLSGVPEVAPIDAPKGSPSDLLLSVGCGPRVPQVQGTYEGTNDLTTKDGHGDQKISIVVKQTGKDISVSYQTPFGGQGAGTGTLTDGAANSMLLNSTAPNCPGSYEASFKFAADTVSWTYKGQDCGGAVEGHGTAKKT